MIAWDRRWMWAAAAMALAMMLAAIFLRPLWRDEYWALYFSNPGTPLNELIFEKITKHEHPPAYFGLLYLWRLIFDNDIWARLLSIPIYAAAGWTIWRLGKDRARETIAFLLLAATGYWVIYFGIEARMYGLMFAGCAVTCFVARRALEGKAVTMAAIFAAWGFFTAMSHLFSAMWIGVLGGWMTLAFAKRQNWPAAFAWAAATAVSVGPAIGWVIMVRPDEIYDNPIDFWKEAGMGANQFLRGLVVKTFFSNLPAFIAAFLCLGALWRKKDPFDAVMGLSIAACVIIPFAIHVFVEPMIKERAFIIIMPAVILLAVRAIGLVGDNQPFAKRMISWVPIAALIAPILFIPEYFKDRERLGEVRAFVAQHPHCAGAPVAIYYREAIQGADWSRFVAHRALKGAVNGRDLDLVDLEPLTTLPPATPGCPLRAIAPMLPRNETVLQQEAREMVAARGGQGLEERALGERRTLIFLDPAP